MPHLTGLAGAARRGGEANGAVATEREDGLNLRILTICTGLSVAAHAALLLLSLPPEKVESGHHERVEVGLITTSVQDRFSTPQAAATGARPEAPRQPRPPAAPYPLPANPPRPAPVAPDLTSAMARAAAQLPARPAMPPIPVIEATQPRPFHVGMIAARSNPDTARQPANGSTTTATAPRVASNPPPAYPRQAREEGWAGSVWLQIRVGSNGRVEAVNLEQSSGYPLLDETAIEAVRRWNFEPARQAGQAIATMVRVPIRFRLEDD